MCYRECFFLFWVVAFCGVNNGGLTAEQPVGVITMQLSSSAFEQGQPIPEKYTGVGEDLSPPLTWADAPEGTKSFALICDDPDAPSRENPRPEGPWVHWVIYNLSGDLNKLPEGVPRGSTIDEPVAARQGRNDFSSENDGYRGPMPPPGSGPHRYLFHLYALDDQLHLKPSEANKESVLAAMQGHVLDQVDLMGTFERK